MNEGPCVERFVLFLFFIAVVCVCVEEGEVSIRSSDGIPGFPLHSSGAGSLTLLKVSLLRPITCLFVSLFFRFCGTFLAAASPLPRSYS